MASLASINIRFSADIKEFQTQMQSVQKSMDKVGKDLSKIGANLTTSLTLPLVGLGALAVKSAADMETLKTSLDTVFQGDTAAADSAFAQIKEFAATTPFQMEEVASAFIKLKNLGLDPSIASLTSYGNTASALGKSLDQMIEAVADASVGEFERLKEFGIKAKSQGDNVAFTFQGVTTTVGKNSEEISQYLQNIGNVNFAGSIERQAGTFAGKLSTLRDNLTQAFAGIGAIIIDYINPLFEKLNGILKNFQDLSPETKKWIVILGGVAAAIGPLLALAGTILPAIITGFTLLTGPIGLVVAALTAVGIIIVQNWAPIKKVLIDIANYFIDLYNESTLFRVAVQGVIATFKTLFEVGKFLFEALKSYLQNFKDNFVENFKTIGAILKAVLTGNFEALPGIIANATKEGKKNFSAFTDNLGKDWKNLVSGIKDNFNESIDAVTSRKKIEFLKENVDATAVKDAVSNAVKNGMSEGAGGTGEGGRAQTSGLDLTGLAQGTTALTESPLTGIAGKLPIELESIDANLIEFQNKLLDFQENSAGILEGIAGNFIEGFANVVAGIAQGTVSFGAVGGLLLSTLGDLATQLGRAAISIGLTMKAVKLSFANPLSAIAAGAALLVVGGLLKGLSANFGGGGKVEAFADGGIVGGNSYYGDKILARVNSGELVLNQNQQRSLYGMMNSGGSEVIIPNVVLKGEDMLIQFERAQKRKDRRG